MIHRIVQLFILFPLAVVLIVLAVANRHTVVLSLDPFMRADPAIALSMPLFVLLFVTLLTGVAIGGVAAWIKQGKWRRRARREHEDAIRWQRRAEEAVTGHRAGSAGSPALRRTS